MTDAVKLIIDFMWNLFDKVNNVLVFELFGIQLHFFTFAVSMIVLVMVVSVFWKGAKG